MTMTRKEATAKASGRRAARNPIPAHRCTSLAAALLITAGGSLQPASATPPHPLHAVPAAPDAARALRDIDKVVAASMAKFHSPGMALGVIKDDRVILAKGYGLRNVEENLPVTADTLFPVGSVTKGFTAVLGAMLVDEGKLDWDTPVRAYLPWFALEDPVASEQITLRDMLTHLSGLPSNDALRYAVPLSRQELVRRLRYLDPNVGFRQARQYNNLMYVAAGAVESQVAGSEWESLVRQRIFVPLGMTASNTSVRESATSANFAYGYSPAATPGHFTRLDLYDYQKFGTGPNGAINDLLKYLAFQLHNGQVAGRQLVSDKQMTYMHSSLGVTGGDKYGDSYGLGWYLRDYGGYRLISHPGGIFGFHTFIGFVPELRLGFVVLSNQEASEATRSIAYSIADRIMSLPRTDWVAKLPVPPPEGGDSSLPKPIAPPTHPLVAYTGDYENPAYGRITVSLHADQLTLTFPAISGSVKPHAYDTFDTVFTVGKADVATSQTVFHVGPDGNVDSVSLDLDFDGSPGAKPILFHSVH